LVHVYKEDENKVIPNTHWNDY